MSKILKTPQLRKFIAIATALNLIFSVISPAFVQAQGSTPGFAPINAAAAFDPKNFVIPFNIGRISDSVNFNSDRVIVQIQDLHSHEETQRNIANILSYLDSKHTIDNIYVEGADKEIDAAWLGEIEEAISDSLLKRGILTGAELYLIKSQKPRVLKGIEDRQIYADNFKRLIKIYESKAEIEALLPQVREFLNYTAQKYYGKENKKINRLISKYKSGEISFEKYFTRIVKKAKKQNIYFDFYPSISLFADIMEKQNKLDEKKVNAETEAVLNELKKRLSFAQYKELIDYWQNRQTQGIFYFQLARFINEFNYGTKYESLYEFLNFTSLNQQINPIDLVSQERSLIWEMRNNAALNQKEKEIIFLSSYFELTEGFLSNKITWAEYKYFQRELPRFRRLWTKYTRLSQTPLLVKYYDLFESFYQANEERNKIFIKGVNAKEREEKERQKIPKNAVMTDVYGLIERAKKIDVIITGGFHTQEVSKILQEARQSYVVITPNVTENADIADKLFEEDVFRTSAYMQENAFQKPLFLQSLQEALNSKDPANIIFLLKENIFSDKELMENAKPEMLQKEINKLASGKFSIKLRDGAITVEIEGKEASAAIIEYPKRKEETKEKTVLRRAEKKSIENYNKALDNYRFLKNEKTKKELEKAIHKIEKYKLEHSALLETDIETAKKETQSSGKKPVRFIDALFASFNERKTIKKIAKAYGELLDKQAVEEIEKAQKKYGEILKEFLNSHSEYDASKLGSYEKGVQTIVYAAHKAYAITFKVIRIKAVADFAADIANVIVHLYWNILAKLKNDRPFLTSDITYLPKLKGTVPQECFDIFPQDMPVLTLKEIDGYKKSNDEKGFIVIVNNLSSLESMLPIESKIRNMRKYKFYRDNKAIAVFNAEGKITMAYIISGGKITDIISDYTVAVMEAGALDNNGIPKFAKPLAFYNFRERFSWVNAIKDRGKSHIILSSLDTYGNFSSNYQYRIINADEPYAFKDVMLITDEQSAITKGYILDKGKILLEFENLNKNSADIPVMVTSEEKDIIDKLKKEKNISKERIVFSKLSIYSELYVNNQKVMTIKDTAFKNCIALAVLGKKNRVSKVYLLNSQTLEAVEYNNVNIDNDAYPAPYMSKSLDGVSEYIEVFYYDGVDENGTPLVKENAKPVYYRAEILSFQYKYNISPPVYANKKIVVRGRVGKNEANIITKQIKFPKGSAGAQFLAVVDDKGKLESVHYQTDKGFTQIYS
ncbi:MAG: hypothetical protein LBU09_00375, partial [Endomicrobium sp.]|nr:hypothetical protein [Endomicrobium sp.]